MRNASSGWSRVATGLQMVASAAAQQTTNRATSVASRVSHHGMEVASTARRAAVAVSPMMIKTVYDTVNQTSSVVVNRNNDDNNYSYATTKNTTMTTPSKEEELVNFHEQDQPFSNIVKEKSLEMTENNDLQQQEHGAISNREHVNADIMDKPETWTVNVDKMKSKVPAASTIHHEEEETKETLEFAASVEPDQPVEAAATDASSSAAAVADSEEGDAPSRFKEGQPVPSTRIERAAGFASLGFGLAMGAASEMMSRMFRSSPSSSSPLLATNDNADRLAASLCRMRGAALKMGQMLSIQDESMMPPALSRALKQVRQGADAMPTYQLERQMKAQFGDDWREKFESFDDIPFAAASIGQVHRAKIRNDDDGTLRRVAVKVQYPGVANSIESDLRNLTMLVTMTGFAPKGLFIENVIRVGRDELKVECDYQREKENQQRFQELVHSDPYLRQERFVVPDVIKDLTSSEVITTGFAPGGTIDKVSFLDQEERNRIGRAIMYLTMKELFVWRFMQTDPNWGNFLYDVGTGQTYLIDFGASREYSKSFVDGYLRIVWASANKDFDTLMEQSHKMGFLTGEENDVMLNAHKMSAFTVGEPFMSNEPFDFRGSSISSRMGEHTSVFLKHRLTPPPEEVYTLHRKLAGAYMLCIKLGAVINCRELLEEVYLSHVFDPVDMAHQQAEPGPLEVGVN